MEIKKIKRNIQRLSKELSKCSKDFKNFIRQYAITETFEMYIMAPFKFTKPECTDCVDKPMKRDAKNNYYLG